MSQPRAKKSLGQHFLRDKNISEKIVRALRTEAKDKVIEIGPGPGALTNILEEHPLQHLLLLEKDRHFAAERQRLRKKPHTQAVLMDALHMDWSRINKDNPWKIISNLPYNVASPLMWDIFSETTGLVRAVFMMQKEVGERIVAKPGTKDYGALSVWIQSFVQPQWEFVVGPKSFSPPPKVDSAVLSFTPLSLAQRPKHANELAKLIKMCFQNRRKQLKSLFKQNNAPQYIQALEALQLAPTLRPENLTPKNFQDILLHSKQSLDFTC